MGDAEFISSTVALGAFVPHTGIRGLRFGVEGSGFLFFCTLSFTLQVRAGCANASDIQLRITEKSMYISMNIYRHVNNNRDLDAGISMEVDVDLDLHLDPCSHSVLLIPDLYLCL